MGRGGIWRAQSRAMWGNGEVEVSTTTGRDEGTEPESKTVS